MLNKHLSEIEIQEYIDTFAAKEKVENHIATCDACAIRLAEYQSFYTKLSADYTPELSVDFISQTMHLVKQEEASVESNIVYYFYTIASLVGIIAFMKYYIGFDFNKLKFHLPQLTNMFSDWTIFQSATDYYQTSTSSVNVLLFAGAILLFFALVDSIMSRKKINSISSFSI